MSKYKINHLKILNKVKLLTDHEINHIDKECGNCIMDGSVKVLLYFDKTLLALLTSILFLEKDSTGSFAQNILYRTVLEVFFKAWLIFVSMKDHGTKYALLFLDDYPKYEFTGYLNKMKPFLSETKSKEIKDLLDKMPAQFPKDANDTFKWTGVLKLLTEFGTKYDTFMDDTLKDQFIVEYSYLCSYVHGGYDAVEGFYDNVKSFTPKENLLGRSLHFFITNRTNIFILFSIENKKNYFDLANKLIKIREESEYD